MFLVCVACNKVVKEIEPLRSTEITPTVCNECQHEATLRYFKMLNELYFEKQLILEQQTGTDKS